MPPALLCGGALPGFSCIVGDTVGERVGDFVGPLVGETVGNAVGDAVGRAVSASVVELGNGVGGELGKGDKVVGAIVGSFSSISVEYDVVGAGMNNVS